MKKHRVVFWMRKHHAVGTKGARQVTGYTVHMSVTVYVWASDTTEALRLAKALDYVQQLTDIIKIEAEEVD